jgi:hypothetical protein
MIAYVYALDAQGRERLPGAVSWAYQSIATLKRYWLRRGGAPGTYRVEIHWRRDRGYGPADHTFLWTVPPREGGL